MTIKPPRRGADHALWPTVCLAAAAALWGCGGGSPVAPVPPSADNPHEWVEESRALAGVRGLILDVSVVCSLRIEQGATESIWIRGDETVLPFLTTNVRDGLLELRYPFDVNPSVRPPKLLEMVLTAIDLDSVELRDSGSISSASLSLETLALRSSGSGEMTFTALSARELEIELLAGGRIQAAGEVGRQRARLTGPGAYDSRHLASREADVEVSNTGSATIRVSELLRATISGSGSIYYYGDPLIESFITGSGRLVRLGD